MGSTRHELGKLSARGRRCVRPAGLREGPGALRPTPGSPRKLGPSCQTRPTRTAPPHPGLRTGGRVVGAMAVCPLSWAGEAEEAPPQQVLGDEDTTARAVACGFSLAQEANICCSQEAPLRWGGGGGQEASLEPSGKRSAGLLWRPLHSLCTRGVRVCGTLGACHLRAPESQCWAQCGGEGNPRAGPEAPGAGKCPPSTYSLEALY